MTTIRRVLRTDGSSEDLPAPLSIEDIERLIGATCIDCVNLRHLGDPLHVMCVDDLGYETEQVEVAPGHFEVRCLKPRKPVNDQATKLYHLNCRPGTTHQIVGDVVIVPDDDFSKLEG